MFIFLLIFIIFYSLYYYFSYQVILLNDLNLIFSQTAVKAQEDLKQYSDLLLEDLAKCYTHILVIILFATILTFIWILFLKYNAKLIIWLSIFSLPIILSVGLYYSVTTYINLKTNQQFTSPFSSSASLPTSSNSATGGLEEDSELTPFINDLSTSDAVANDATLSQSANNNHNNEQQTLPFDKAIQTILATELISYVRNETLWLVISIVLFLILTLSFIILHSLRERVSLSIALIRQASKAINGVKSTLIFPIIPRTFAAISLIYGLLISLLIISASHPTYHIVGGPQNGQPCHPRSFNPNRANMLHHHATSFPQRNKRNNTLVTNNFAPSFQQQTIPPTNTNQQVQVDSAISLPKPSAQVRFDGPVISRLSNSNNNNQNHNINNSNISKQFSSINRLNQTILNQRPQCIMYIALSRQHVWKYHAINLFATLWLIHFISGVSQTTLAGAFASYYWAFRKPRDVPFFAVTASLYRTIRYHLGDIAFGSFLIATIRYIRIIIEFIDNRIRRNKSTDVNNATTRSATCFFRIFFWLLDRFLKYIDRNAYIMMSMYGEGYLASAKRAVELLYKNSTRALVLDYVTYFVLLVSRLLITGIAGYITAQEMFTANLHYKWLPITLVVIGTYFISKGLFSVYSMAVDTLFICFLIDSTNNDGSTEKPYFMSKDLRRIIKRNTVIP